MPKPSLDEIFAEKPSLESIFAEQQVAREQEVNPIRGAYNQVIGGINTAINTATGNIPEIIANRFGTSTYPPNVGDVAKGIGAGVGFIAPTGLPAQVMKAGAAIANPLTRNIAQGALGMATQFPVGEETAGGYTGKVILGGVAGAVGRGIEKAVGGMTKTVGEKIADAAKQYRKILNPSKTELNNLQLKLGKDVDKYYELAAKEGLIIKQSPEGRLDTQDAILQLQDKKTALVDDLNTVLASKKETFNLNNIALKAKEEIKNKVKNATEFKELSKQIDTYIKDEIQANAGKRVVDAATLNKIKQGMWSVSYDPLRPNTRTAAREVGFAAKNAIDSAFEDVGIRKVNDTLGQYYTLETLLTNANNRPIGGSSFKRIASSVAGAIAGRNVPVVGPFVGSHIGSGIASRMMNPEGATRAMAASVKNPGISPREKFSNFIKGIK